MEAPDPWAVATLGERTDNGQWLVPEPWAFVKSAERGRDAEAAAMIADLKVSASADLDRLSLSAWSPKWTPAPTRDGGIGR